MFANVAFCVKAKNTVQWKSVKTEICKNKKGLKHYRLKCARPC